MHFDVKSVDRKMLTIQLDELTRYLQHTDDDSYINDDVVQGLIDLLQQIAAHIDYEVLEGVQLRCPACSRSTTFRILQAVVSTPMNLAVDVDGRPSHGKYDSLTADTYISLYNNIQCNSCGHSGIVAEFKVNDEQETQRD